MSIITKGSWHENRREYHRRFDRRNSPGSGFSFDCDAEGRVDVHSLTADGYMNYRKCVDGIHDVIDRGVERYEYTVFHAAEGMCPCGEEIILDCFTNPCPRCYTDYNMSGQRLDPRHLWGEETGEHWSECL